MTWLVGQPSKDFVVKYKLLSHLFVYFYDANMRIAEVNNTAGKNTVVFKRNLFVSVFVIALQNKVP